MTQSENSRNHIAALEALLFAYGEPMTLKKLSSRTGLEQKIIVAHLAELEARYNGNAASGLTMFHRGDEFQLVTKPAHAPLIKSLVKAEMQEELTPAAQETLAIIAYGGTVGRADIDYVRGVNSSFILRSLLLRGLIDRAPDPHRANAYRYALSFECLKHLGATTVETLPDYEKYRQLIEKLHTANAQSEEVKSSGLQTTSLTKRRNNR